MTTDDNESPSGKLAWPELVGVLAAMVITHERPDVAVELLPPGSPVTPDYNTKRVRVYIDNNGIVAKVPVMHRQASIPK